MTEIEFLDKSALITELEANLWEFWSTFGRGPGCALHDEGDALWFENPIPIIPYNGILRFQVEKNVELMPGMVRSLADLPESPLLPEGIEVREIMSEKDSGEYYDFVSWC